MFLGGRIIGGYSCFIVRAFKFFDNIFLILSLYCNIYFVLLHYFSIMRLKIGNNEIYRERTGKFER